MHEQNWVVKINIEKLKQGLVTEIRHKNIRGHCITVMDFMVFDGLNEVVLPFSEDNLYRVLHEKVAVVLHVILLIIP